MELLLFWCTLFLMAFARDIPSTWESVRAIRQNPAAKVNLQIFKDTVFNQSYLVKIPALGLYQGKTSKRVISEITLNRLILQTGLYATNMPYVLMEDGSGEKSPPWIATKYYEHGDLGDYIKKTAGAPSMEEIRTVARNLLQAVKHLKDRVRVSHGDIKPHNIVITKMTEGKIKEVRLIDFEMMNSPDTFAFQYGTVEYTSPEICHFHKSSIQQLMTYDAKQIIFPSEVYAIGLTLMEFAFKQNRVAIPLRLRGVLTSACLYILAWQTEMINALDKFMCSESENACAPLIKLLRGLLEPDYTKRLTVEQALKSEFLQ